jgi:hypothetical protein
MSLIQEALKRKDDENSGIPPKAIPVIPLVAHEPAVRQPDIPAKHVLPLVKEEANRAWPVLVISLLVASTLALAAIGVLLWSIKKGGQPATAVPVAVEVPAPPVVVPQPVAVSAPEPVREEQAPVQKPVEPLAEAAPATETVTQAPAASASAPVVFSIATGVVKEGSTEKAAPPQEISVVPVSRPVSLQSSWPTLKVVGVMAPRSAAQSGAAIIDGNLVECGDEIRGVKVQGVDKAGVWFEFKSQTQFVRVGQTTL